PSDSSDASDATDSSDSSDPSDSSDASDATDSSDSSDPSDSSDASDATDSSDSSDPSDSSDVSDATDTSDASDPVSESPTWPEGAELNLGVVTETAITVSWPAAIDTEPGVVYSVSLDGSDEGTTSETSYTFTGLTINTSYNLSVIARDTDGQETAPLSLTASTVDLTAPSFPASPVVELLEASEISLAIEWSEASDNVGVTSYRITLNESSTRTSPVASISISGLEPLTEYTIQIQALDSADNASSPITVTLMTLGTVSSVPPGDAEVDNTVVTNFDDLTSFLIAQDGYQGDVDSDSLNDERKALLQGKVVGLDGIGVEGVEVTAVHRPEFGTVYTLEDGSYFFVVNGEADVTLRFESAGLVPMQRRAQANWNGATSVQDVVMRSRDSLMTEIDLTGASSEYQLAVANPVQECESCPTRTARVIFPSGTRAQVYDGASWDFVTEPSMVQLTEFTTDDSGRDQMPGALPPTSDYTYAIDLFIHQGVLKEDGVDVKFFDQAGGESDVLFWEENFLGFPVGSRVPTGYFDDVRDTWVAIEDGFFVEVTDIVDGKAVLNLGGRDAGELGITNDELTVVAGFATIGQSYMRVPFPHFSNMDCNHGSSPDPRAKSPDQEEPSGDPGDCDSPLFGSVIDCQRQTVGQSIPLDGTRMSLDYNSQRTAGYLGRNSFEIPLTVGLNDDALEVLKKVTLKVYAIGFEREWNWNCEQDDCSELKQEVDFTQYLFNRRMNGRYSVSVLIEHEYPSFYNLGPESWGESTFGVNQYTELSGIQARENAVFQQRYRLNTGNYTSEAQGLGGWSISDHHVYDRQRGELFLGTGNNLALSGEYSVVESIARVGDKIYDPVSGNQLNNFYVSLQEPIGVNVDSDGAVLVGGSRTNSIIRIDADNRSTIMLKGKELDWFSFDCPDNVIDQPSGRYQVCAALMVGARRGPDDRVYATDYFGNYNAATGTGSGRIKVYDPELAATGQEVTTYAGGNQICDQAQNLIGDGCPATEAILVNPVGLAFGPDRSMYIAELGGHRIRKIDPAGIIWTIAGQTDEAGAGVSGYEGDGGLATLATLNSPTDILVKEDGTIIVSDLGNHVVRAVSADGRINTIAGTGEKGYTGSGLRATESALAYPGGLALNSSGELLIADGSWTPFLEGTPERGNQCVRRLSSEGSLEDVVGRCGVLASCSSFESCGDGGPAASAVLGFVNGLAVDSEDRIIIADYTNSRVRRVRPVHEANQGDLMYILGPNQKEVFVFDLDGRHLETRNARTQAVQLTFHYVGGESNLCAADGVNDGRLCAVTDAYGNQVTIEYSSDGATITSPTGAVTELSFDAFGYTNTIQNSHNQTYQFEYTQAPDGSSTGLMSGFQHPNGESKEYRYSLKGRLSAAVSEDDTEREFEQWVYAVPYSDERSIGVRRSRVTTPMARTLIYDSSRYRSELHSSLLYPGYDDSLYGYYNAEIYPDGSVTETVMDRGASRYHAVYPHGKRQVVDLSYHPRWTGSTKYPSYTQTSQGIGGDVPTRTTETTLAVTLNDGNPLELVSALREQVTNETSTTTWSFDAGTGVLGLESGEGRQASWTLSPEGLLQESTVNGYGTYELVYQGDSRLKQVIHTDGESTRNYVIDRVEEGDLIIHTVTHPDGVEFEIWTTQAMRRIAKRWNTDDGTITLGYDDNGRVQELTGPAGNVYRFDFDSAGRLVSILTPSPENSTDVRQVLSLDYNLDGQLLAVNNPDQTARISYNYDEYGRVIEASGEDYQVGQFYSGVSGQLAGYSRVGLEPAESVDVDLNWQGELLTSMTYSGAVSGSVSYSYDDFFYRSSETVSWSGGLRTVNTSYDSDGFLASRGDYSITRAAGTEQQIEARVGDIRRTTTYNGFGEVTGESYDLVSTAEVLFSEAIVRNDVGQVSEREETFMGTNQTITYGYDGRRRLIGASAGGVSSAWDYDQNDNLTGTSHGASSETFTYNLADQLASSSEHAYSYDEKGQLRVRTETGSGSERGFDYDAAGQLSTVTMEDGRVIRYILDPFGNRVQRLVDGVETHRWLYDTNRRPVVEYQAALGTEAYFVYAGNEYHPAYMVQAGTTYAFVVDKQGNTRALVDSDSGVVRAAFTYTAFGQLADARYFDATGAEAADNDLVSSFGFAGGMVDPDTDMVWLQNRWYMPELGRWSTRDPSFFLSGQWNTYAYSYNNPINFIDTDGRLANVLAGCAIGAAWVGVTSAALAGLGGSTLYCSLKAGFGGAVGGCIGGALGPICGGGIGCGMLTNGLGNMGSAGTDMLTGARDSPSNLGDFGKQMGDAFTDGALGGAMSAPGAGTPSKAINDMVENVVTTTTGGGLSAMRNFSEGI
ncbi:MAG: hypothetical protein HOK97_03160, partial [Deltaproteobacteria bacterium]|nr:hypothetical protein [Deltaproteobacteria bacterium]